jgi:hypothetical protein
MKISVGLFLSIETESIVTIDISFCRISIINFKCYENGLEGLQNYCPQNALPPVQSLFSIRGLEIDINYSTCRRTPTHNLKMGMDFPKIILSYKDLILVKNLIIQI